MADVIFFIIMNKEFKIILLKLITKILRNILIIIFFKEKVFYDECSVKTKWNQLTALYIAFSKLD